MSEPENITKKLKNTCPKCKGKLYAFWDTCCGDHPELGLWQVECENGDCNYIYNGEFPSLEWLKEEFEIDED